MFLRIPPLLFIYSLIFMYFTPVHYHFKLSPLIPFLFFVLGVLIAINSVSLFTKYKANISPLDLNSTTHLIDTGIYRYTRNPMYLSLLLILIAYFFYLGNPLSIWGIFFYYFMTTKFQIKKEEKLLLKQFGNQYQAYMHRVRRWI